MKNPLRRGRSVWVVLSGILLLAGAVAKSAPLQASAGLSAGVDHGGSSKETVPVASAPTKDEFRENYFFGDWLGLRPLLASRGINLQVLVINDPFGNVTGGKEKGFTDYNLLCVDLAADTEKMIGWHGGEFHIGFADNSGTSLSDSVVGNTFPIQLADVAPVGPRLTYLSYTQSLFEDKLSVRVGRLTINSVYDEEFAASPYFNAFSSVAFNLIPMGIFLNAPGAFGYPLSTWGARIKFEPAESFYAMAGCYNGDPRVKDANRYGLDFTFNGPPFVIGEVGYRRNPGKEAEGLPGNLKAGAYFNGGNAAEFGSGSTSRGRCGFYVLGDQSLVQWGDRAENRHLGIFGAFVCAPDQSVNEMPYFFDAGLVAYGPMECRAKDFIALGAAYGAFSSDLRSEQKSLQKTDPSVAVQSCEMTIELSYGCQVRPGLLVQPALQYIVNPGGDQSVPGALAIGANIVVSF